jgi:hypothetical protein
MIEKDSRNIEMIKKEISQKKKRDNNIGGIMSYGYPSSLRVPSPPISSSPSELSPTINMNHHPQIPLKAY